MREFKFRVWDKTNKSFLCCSDDDDLFINIQGDIYLVRETLRDAYDLDYLSSSFYEISQCTGLKDKNGKEIYGGDIVKAKTIMESMPIWIGEVMRECDYIGIDKNECAEWVIVDKKLGSYIAFYPNQDREIIGNIYENSELLGGKNE